MNRHTLAEKGSGRGNFMGKRIKNLVRFVRNGGYRHEDLGTLSWKMLEVA